LIDEPFRTARLLERLEDVLPLPAILPSGLRKVLGGQTGAAAPERCEIVSASYAGDEGGIMCHLQPGGREMDRVFVVSLSLLFFDPRTPLARELNAYVKHRLKRLKRGHRAEASLENAGSPQTL